MSIQPVQPQGPLATAGGNRSRITGHGTPRPFVGEAWLTVDPVNTGRRCQSVSVVGDDGRHRRPPRRPRGGRHPVRLFQAEALRAPLAGAHPPRRHVGRVRRAQELTASPSVMTGRCWQWQQGNGPEGVRRPAGRVDQAHRGSYPGDQVSERQFRTPHSGQGKGVCRALPGGRLRAVPARSAPLPGAGRAGPVQAIRIESSSGRAPGRRWRAATSAVSTSRVPVETHSV